MFGPATIEGDKCARQGPRGGEGLLLPRAAARWCRDSRFLFLLIPATSRYERAYLHLETGYVDARAS